MTSPKGEPICAGIGAAPSSNGKIPDSDSVYRGSNPRGASSRFHSFLRIAAKLLGGAVGLWLLAALFGAIIPRNGRWNEPSNHEAPTIWLVSNGWHTGLILPAVAGGEDLSLTFRPTDLPDPDDAGDYLLFGWGDRDFYLDTPSWSDFRPKTALVALFGSGGSLLHVDHLAHPAEAVDPRPIRLTPNEMDRLIAAIKASLAPDRDGRAVPVPGYGRRDVFYHAHGRYSAFNTCNAWTGDMLAAAGVRVGLWTPLPPALMWSHRRRIGETR